MAKLVAIVIETSKEAYPELGDKEAYIHKIISIEEDRFAETIDHGLMILNGYIEEMEEASETTLAGDKAFTLYDTYGFPLDLTLEILEEKNMAVDEIKFKEAMEEQRTRAREAREESNYMGAKETVYNQLDPDLTTTFVGYDHLTYSSVVTAITTADEVVESAASGQAISLFVEETPFYATSGGQQADVGLINIDGGQMKVTDVKKLLGGKFAHVGQIISGSVKVGDTVELVVDQENRKSTMKNHSATHLLQKALKNVLGDHVEQAGSSVNKDRLRFDFTHFTAMTDEEISAVEKEVNEMVGKEMNVTIEELPIAEAKERGAMALFGEKYGDVVRVVTMGDYSVELCGGTHLDNTSAVGTFKIVSEGGVAAGVRRIEALTGQGAMQYYVDKEQLVKEASSKLKADPNHILAKIESVIDENRALKQELDKLKAKLANSAADDLLGQSEQVGDVKFLAANVADMDGNGLRDMGDNFKSKLDNGVVVLASGSGDKVNLVVMATDEAVKKGVHAGNIIREAAKVVGGGGGGRPNMAQAGGKLPAKIDEALLKAKEVLSSQLGL